MKREAKQVVTEFLSAVQQGNNEVLGALIHPEIEWSQPGNNLVSGTKRSNAEVFQMVGKMFELSANTLRLTKFTSVSANENNVACLLHWEASKPGGEVLNVHNIDVYTVEDEKIVRAEIFTTDEVQENEFWKN